MALTEIQKDIERRNIELGRKLLAYDVMLRALQEINELLTPPTNTRMKLARERAGQAIAKAENKP